MGKGAAEGGLTVGSKRWLVLQIDAPLIAFGDVSVDQFGPVRDFPATSMLVGIFANAMGWRWTDTRRHDRLQERMVFAARRDREGVVVTDVQNARLGKNDKGWTTFGEPEGRAGGDKTYQGPHRRFRDFHADLAVRVVTRLKRENEAPTLDEIAAALDRPARPLFFGRKPCLPSKPILGPKELRWINADSAYEALCGLQGERPRMRAQWPLGAGPDTGEAVVRVVDLPDLRGWHKGVHSGSRTVVEGWACPSSSP